MILAADAFRQLANLLHGFARIGASQQLDVHVHLGQTNELIRRQHVLVFLQKGEPQLPVLFLLERIAQLVNVERFLLNVCFIALIARNRVACIEVFLLLQLFLITKQFCLLHRVLFRSVTIVCW